MRTSTRRGGSNETRRLGSIRGTWDPACSEFDTQEGRRRIRKSRPILILIIPFSLRSPDDGSVILNSSSTFFFFYIVMAISAGASLVCTRRRLHRGKKSLLQPKETYNLQQWTHRQHQTATLVLDHGFTLPPPLNNVSSELLRLNEHREDGRSRRTNSPGACGWNDLSFDFFFPLPPP